MPPKLAELVAYCRENGISGSYAARRVGTQWRARIRVGRIIHTAPAATEDEALERAAACALDDLMHPMPTQGTAEYVAWEAQRRAPKI